MLEFNAVVENVAGNQSTPTTLSNTFQMKANDPSTGALTAAPVARRTASA